METEGRKDAPLLIKINGFQEIQNDIETNEDGSY